MKFGFLTGLRAMAVATAGATILSIASPVMAQDASPVAGVADLAAIKAYSAEQAATQKKETSELRPIVQRYYDLAESTGFNYDDLWETNAIELSPLLAVVKQKWLVASNAYESNEGIVAGVPSLSYYDAWIDAGPSGEEDPEGALDWQLTLPNGEVLAKPGNFFTHLTEPAIWGTVDAFVGLKVDLDGDGTIELGEVLPEANVFKASMDGLDDATTELVAAIDAWEPTIEDAFAALTTMIPTMNEYFEQWKLSVYVTGDTSGEVSYVANSRLLDINGIVAGLDLTYKEISPVVSGVDPALHTQIDAGFTDLVTYVQDLYTQEQGGTKFTPEQADLFGSEAQAKATTLVGLISQAVALLGIQI